MLRHAVESPPPGDPSEAEAFRILYGGVVMVRGDRVMGCGRRRPKVTGSTRTALRVEREFITHVTGGPGR
jgi:hypothetical protein